MIKTNLSTRPFYNVQAVNLWMGLAAVVLLVATLLNVASILRHSQSDSALVTQAAQDGERSTAARREAAKLRASVDARQIELISTEARKANDLIDRRVFSWTELFNQFEKTLPGDVRLTAVRPTIDKSGRIVLTVAVVSHGVDPVNEFMENLEKTGSFAGLLTREERVNNDGQLEATLQSFYAPAVAPAEARQ
jgi:Tfp pilus assembly protein PilN